jgi:hypothetical protein
MAFFGVFYFRVLLLKAAGWMLGGLLSAAASNFDYPALAAAVPVSLIAPLAIIAPP